jgi:hypothetical protein
MIKIGKADELSASHRHILTWVESMTHAINEQQKIFVKRSGNIDQGKVGYYLISMPSEQIAQICTMHLMKILIQSFT